MRQASSLAQQTKTEVEEKKNAQGLAAQNQTLAKDEEKNARKKGKEATQFQAEKEALHSKLEAHGLADTSVGG
jgi:hypothetical protein